MPISFIGDVHGLYDRYCRIQRKCSYSLQLGDFGFAAEWSRLARSRIDPQHHRVLAGNHDCYPVAQAVPHYLGEFGLTRLGGLELFFVRGARSSDGPARIPGSEWWEEEELTDAQLGEAVQSYGARPPDVVVSHDCPQGIITEFAATARVHEPASRTREALQRMFEIHPPRVWVFGHHHKSRGRRIGDTHFQCVGELQRWDLT